MSQHIVSDASSDCTCLEDICWHNTAHSTAAPANPSTGSNCILSTDFQIEGDAVVGLRHVRMSRAPLREKYRLIQHIVLQHTSLAYLVCSKVNKTNWKVVLRCWWKGVSIKWHKFVHIAWHAS